MKNYIIKCIKCLYDDSDIIVESDGEEAFLTFKCQHCSNETKIELVRTK